MLLKVEKAKVSCATNMLLRLGLGQEERLSRDRLHHDRVLVVSRAVCQASGVEVRSAAGLLRWWSDSGEGSRAAPWIDRRLRRMPGRQAAGGQGGPLAQAVAGAARLLDRVRLC